MGELLVSETAVNITIEGFQTFLWVVLAVCYAAYGFHAYGRIVVFRKFLSDDWPMMLSLVIMLAHAILSQITLKYTYTIKAYSDGTELPGADFYDVTGMGVRSFGAAVILSYLAVWSIKISFMLFFYRLGHQFTGYLIFWWTTMILVIGSGVTAIAVIQYPCIYGPIEYVVNECGSGPNGELANKTFTAACIIDAFTDVLIICFPVSILWRVRISIGQRLALSGVFSLVAFTIAITIVRGTVYGNLYQGDGTSTQTIGTIWVWFWLSVEQTVSFLIACLISFRALFTRYDRAREEHARRNDVNPTVPQGSSLPARLQRLHRSILDTLRTLEDPDLSTVGSGRTHFATQHSEGRDSIHLETDDSWHSQHGTLEKTISPVEHSVDGQSSSIRDIEPAHMKREPGDAV